MKKLILLLTLFLLSPSTALADPCFTDFDCNGSVYPSDLMVVIAEYGRTDCETCLWPRHPAPVPKTGQTTSYESGDDGDLERGVELPDPRFTDNEDGTVTDNLTGLMWLKNADCFGIENWSNAISDCNGLASGSCGLTDGSIAGDWRLPNSNELASLVHKGYYNPAVPNTAGTGQWSEGDPFTNVQSSYYWSSTTLAFVTVYAWDVHMYNGYVGYDDKAYNTYVWPVRGETPPVVTTTVPPTTTTSSIP